MKKLTGGIIGFGAVGEAFARVFQERNDAEIVSACDINPHRLKVAGESFGFRTFRRAEDLIREDIDFVVISSTNSAHRSAVVAAARRGRHILCEKPVALNLKDAREMARAVQKAGVINVVNYTYRFNPVFRKMAAEIQNQTIGKLLFCWVKVFRGFGLYSGGSRHWAIERPVDSGGWIVHHASHSVDLCLWFGGRIDSVYCRTASTAGRTRSEEIASGLLNYHSGAFATISDSIVNLRDAEFGVSGDQGTLFIRSEAGGEVLRVKRETGKPSADPADSEIIPPDEPSRAYHAGVADHFLDCIKTGRQSAIDIAEGARSLEVCLALKESAKTGRIVKIPR